MINDLLIVQIDRLPLSRWNRAPNESSSRGPTGMANRLDADAIAWQDVIEAPARFGALSMGVAA